jgi:hypothetical protein
MSLAQHSGFRPRIHEESPWYGPIAPWLARFSALARFPSPDELSALYHERTSGLGLPALRFVACAKSKKKKKRPRAQPIELGLLYEGRVVERGEVPTRPDDWHDLFNALAFIAFPRAKWALHARQYALLKARIPATATRLPNARTREQDALTLFDEGGICVLAPAALGATLHEADDALLAAAHKAGSARVLPFGHALYEHLAAGLPCPLGTSYVLAPPAHAQLAPDAIASARLPELLESVDTALARALADPCAFLVPSRARGSSLTALLAHGVTP